MTEEIEEEKLFKICNGKNSCGKELPLKCFGDFPDKKKDGTVVRYPHYRHKKENK